MILLKFSVGDHVRHRVHTHLHGFVIEINIGAGHHPRYLVECMQNDELRALLFSAHELNAEDEHRPVEAGFES